MARKYIIETDSGSKYTIEDRGLVKRTWFGLKIHPEHWPQEKRIFLFTDDKNLVKAHEQEPRLTLNNIHKPGVSSYPKEACFMLFSEGHSSRIRFVYEIRAAA